MGECYRKCHLSLFKHFWHSVWGVALDEPLRNRFIEDSVQQTIHGSGGGKMRTKQQFFRRILFKFWTATDGE